MHHRPAGPPLSARLTGAVRRGVVRVQRLPRRPAGRLAAGMALTTAVTGLFLAVPVVSTGSGTSPLALDSSSSTATRIPEKSSPVVMGRDGVPAPSSSVADAPGAPSADEAPGSDSSSAAAEVPGSPSQASEPPAGDRTTPSTAAAPSAGGSSVSASSASTSSADAPSSAGRSSAGAPSAGPVSTDAAAEVLALLNAARADAGCDPLVHDGALAAVARAHSADMRDLDFVGRETPEGLDVLDRAAAAGQDNAVAAHVAHGESTPSAVVDSWLDDEDDRADILDCGLRTVGVGVAQGSGGTWWTQLLGD